MDYLAVVIFFVINLDFLVSFGCFLGQDDVDKRKIRKVSGPVRLEA